MGRLSRRDILKSGSLLAAGSAAGIGRAVRDVEAADRAGSKYNWGHTVAFGEQYYRRITDMLESIRLTEMDKVGDIANRMSGAINDGNTVWMQNNLGHMPKHEMREDNAGNPGILRSDTQEGGNIYDRLNSGDVLVTNYVNQQVRDARDSGVYVVGVPVNYVDNEWAPRGHVQPNENDWLLGDVSDIILQSYIPYTQGIVDCPEIPEMKICPSSANPQTAIFWMFQAEVAAKLKNRNAPHVSASADYLDIVIERIHEAYRLQKDYLFDHAPTAAKNIGNGAHFHVSSDHEGVRSEASGVAMGTMMANAFRDDMREGDVHLIASIEPDSPAMVEEAMKAKDMGMFVVCIAPGNSLNLRQYSDVFIDNLSPEGGGVLSIDGWDQKIGTVGGIVNNVMMWIYTAQFVDEMVRRGWIPWFYIGYYMVGGREYDQAVRLYFNRQGF